jgi:hypothetical protein
VAADSLPREWGVNVDNKLAYAGVCNVWQISASERYVFERADIVKIDLSPL